MFTAVLHSVGETVRLRLCRGSFFCFFENFRVKKTEVLLAEVCQRLARMSASGVSREGSEKRMSDASVIAFVPQSASTPAGKPTEEVVVSPPQS